MVEVVSIIAGESVKDAGAATVDVVIVVAVVDAGSSVLACTGGAAAATAGGDCDEDSVLELECCCGSGLVSDILRALLFEEVQFWFKRLYC